MKEKKKLNYLQGIMRTMVVMGNFGGCLEIYFYVLKAL